MELYEAPERLALTEDDRLVPEGHKDARWFYCQAVAMIPLEDAKRYGLLGKEEELEFEKEGEESELPASESEGVAAESEPAPESESEPKPARRPRSKKPKA